MVNWCKFFFTYILLQDATNTCFSSQSKIEKVIQTNQPKPKENIFYYTNGDTVKFTCEISSGEISTISWKEDLGNLRISAPPIKGNHNSLSVTLYSYDNGSIWYCTLFKDADLKEEINAISFVTLEATAAKINNNHNFMHNNLAVTAQPSSEHLIEEPCEIKGSCWCYVLENGRIVSTTTNESNLCIQFVDDSTDDYHIKRLRSGDYESQNVNNEDSTTSTTHLPVTSDGNNVDENADIPKYNKNWIVGTGAAAVVLLTITVILIITIFVCRRRKKNKPTTEGLYATANEVTYIELQLQTTSSRTVVNNGVPYAQVIGFLKKNKKK